ncbi:MAG: ThuA domain-containing protein [Novosphingobium sp.]
MAQDNGGGANPPRIDCVLVAAGLWHDIDYARLELLRLLGTEPRIRTRVFEDFENIEAIRNADILITYTCDVVPSLAAQEALRDWLEAGGRWLALHGTNSILRMMEDGKWHAPRHAPLFMDLLGSQFLSHPPIAPYRVTVADPDHDLTRGIEPFETVDELYHMDLHGDMHVLLETECTEPAPHFAEGMAAPGTHPVMYIAQRGKGAVLYNTLGHCRGHYDMQPTMDWWPKVDRCAWELPVFHDLLARSLTWLMAR